MKDLGPEPESSGTAADVMQRAYELSDMANKLARDVGRLIVSHERSQGSSAEGFRAHTKRFDAPEPFNPGADATACDDTDR